MSHLRRCSISRHDPVHVTQRLLVDGLRSGRCYRVVRRALAEGCARPDFRVLEFSVQTNHIHLICEANDRVALSRGLQGLFIRIAKAINHVLRRKGRVFTDRYHDHVLKDPKQARRALVYVLNNYRKHAAQRGQRVADGWLDPCSSAPDFRDWTGHTLPVRRRTDDPPLPRARAWLLRAGWRRAGPACVNEIPGRAGR